MASPRKICDAIARGAAHSLEQEGFKLAPGGNLVCRDGSSQMWAAIRLSATKERGVIIIDPGIHIYWQTFVDTFGDLSQGIGYGHSSHRDMPCVARHFTRLMPAPPDWDALYVRDEPDIAVAAQQIVESYRRYGHSFVAEWSTPEGALNYIERSGDWVGTWERTLMFCLLDAVKGRQAARAYIDDPINEARTLFESKQLMWLRDNCP